MKAFGTIVNTLLITAIAVVAAFSLVTMLPIPGNIEMKIVQSGSMEPTIHTGSVIIIRPESSYDADDIVTFGADTTTEVPTTHRIVSVRQESGVTYFSTKGDANEDIDAEETPLGMVIGRVLFSVPYAGYLIDFARKPLGFILLVAIPAALIIIHELWGIVEELRRKKPNDKGGARMRREPEPIVPEGATVVQNGTEERIVYTRHSVMEDIYRPERMSVPGTRRSSPILYTALASCLIGGSALGGATLARYGDLELSAENLLAAAILDFGVDADAPRSISLTIEGEGEENGAGFEPFVIEFNPSLPFAYAIEAEITGGDSMFCQALTLKGSAPLFDYDGPLQDLATATTSDASPWPVALSVPPGAGITDGAFCMADLIYKGAQEGAEADEQYHDEERLPLLITYHAPPVVDALSVPSEEEVPGDTDEPPIDPEPALPPTDPLDTPDPIEPPSDPAPQPGSAPEEPSVETGSL